MNMRVSFLKAYIMALVAEGEFRLSDGPAILDRLVACVLADAKTAIKELAELGAAQGLRHGAKKMAAKIDDPFAGAALNHYGVKLAEMIEQEGFGGLWERLKPKRDPNKPKSGLDHRLDERLSASAPPVTGAESPLSPSTTSMSPIPHTSECRSAVMRRYWVVGFTSGPLMPRYEAMA